MEISDLRNTTSVIGTAIMIGLTVALALQSLLLIDNESIGYLKLNLIFQLLYVLLFFVWSYLKSGRYLNAPVIFIGAIYIWHTPFLTGHYFELAKIFEFTGRHLTYGEEFIPKATGMVALCIAAAGIGSIIGSRQQAGNDTISIQKEFNAPLHLNAKRLIWSAFLGYGLLTLIYFLKEGLNSFSGDYLSLYTEHSDTFLYYFYQATKFYFGILLLAMFAFVSSKREFWYAFSLTLVIIAIQFLLGSRSLPFINLLALVICIDLFTKRIPFVLYPAGGIILSVVSFIIESSRVQGVGLNVFNFSATGKEISFLHFFWELGGVIRNVIRTMAFMGEQGIVHGQTFFNSFVYLLPKFYLDGLGFHPGVLRPSEWLIEHSGDIPYGGGIGYSLVAEAYYNFGLIGCLLFLFIGWFVSRNYFKYILTGDRFALLHSLNIVIILSLHMRNDTEAYLRYIVYGSLFIEMLRWLNSKNLSQPAISEVDS